MDVINYPHPILLLDELRKLCNGILDAIIKALSEIYYLEADKEYA